MVWHAFTNAEWDVVCGFDEERGIFIGRGSYVGQDAYTEAQAERAKEIAGTAPAYGAILIHEKTGSFEPGPAELGALREAVKHAHSNLNKDKMDGGKWVFLEGLAAYERWARDFAVKPDKAREMGDLYCFYVYQSTHKAAAGFLEELAVKYPAAAESLRKAAAHFATEANILAQSDHLLGFGSPEGVHAERNRRTAEMRGRAGEEYARGIEAIEEALTML